MRKRDSYEYPRGGRNPTSYDNDTAYRKHDAEVDEYSNLVSQKQSEIKATEKPPSATSLKGRLCKVHSFCAWMMCRELTAPERRKDSRRTACGPAHQTHHTRALM